MKKFIAVTCCVILGVCGLVLTGCGSSSDKYADSEFLGTWNATTASYSGIEMEVESILGGAFTMVLNADGSATVTIADEEETGTWEPTDDGIQLEGDSDLSFTSDDGNLVLDYEGVTMNFEKQDK